MMLKRAGSALALLLAMAMMLGGCGTMQTVKSFSNAYEEPPEGTPSARLRVFAFDAMVRAVPDSDCVDWRLPGAGVMATSMRGFANRNDQSLGMPQGMVFHPPVTQSRAGVAVTELRIKAGRPFTLALLTRGDGRRQCSANGWFTPEPGADYELSYRQVGAVCRLTMHRLLETDSGVRLEPVKLSPAPLCRSSDML
ncbi:MAG TPA: hypothetical protein PLN31_12680 [Azoarcus taiwanensis]|nr:hypothetical protein [Azoarcus taiwanensis]